MSKERKKKEIILTRQNAIILPLKMTEASMTPSLIGNRISVKLLIRLQEPFKEVITDHKKNGGWQLDLFDTAALREKYLGDNKMMFELHMGELVDASKNYQQAFDLVCKIKDIQVIVPVFDDKTGECVSFVRESLYDVVFPGNTEVMFSIRSQDTGVEVEKRRMRLVDYMEFKPVSGFEVDEDSIQYRYKKGTEPKVGISVERHVAEHIFNMRGKYGRILDEVALSSNNKYFAPIYEYLASRQEEGIIEVDYLSWKRKMLGEAGEGGVELKGYKKFAQFNKAILKKVLDEMQSMGEDGIDCWVEKVEKVYLHNERADNPDKLRFHMHITKLGKELYKDKKTDAQMMEIERRLKVEFDQNEVQVYTISKKLPKECLDEMTEKMNILLKKKDSDKIKDWQKYANKSLMSLVADFEKRNEDAKKKEKEEAAASVEAKVLPKDNNHGDNAALTEEDLAKWIRFQNEMRNRVGEQDYSTWFPNMELVGVDKVVHIAVPNKTFADIVEDRFGNAIREVIGNVFGCSVAMRVRK